MRPSLPARLALAAVLVPVWLLSVGSPSPVLPIVEANAGPSQIVPGSGGLVAPAKTADVKIERETLTFDFTSSITQPKVQATYDVANVAGKDISIEAAFIAPGGRDLALSLDGVKLEARETPDYKLPAEWVASKMGLDPRTGEEYQLDTRVGDFHRTTAWSFALYLPSGARGRLIASYEANLGYDNVRADYIIRHLVYVLGPAKNWAGFGGLDVRVDLPVDYVLATAPPLPKLSETADVAHYGGTFQDVPDELLRISTMHVPSPLLPWRRAAQVLVPLLVALAAGAACGRLLSRIRRAWLAFLLAGAIAVCGSMIAGSLLSLIVASAEPLASASKDLLDSDELLVILWTVIAAPVLSGAIGACWAAIGSARRARAIAARS